MHRRIKSDPVMPAKTVTLPKYLVEPTSTKTFSFNPHDLYVTLSPQDTHYTSVTPTYMSKVDLKTRLYLN